MGVLASMSSPDGSKRRNGKRGRDESKGETPPDVTALAAFLSKEEDQLRAQAKEVLNTTLIQQTEAIVELESELEGISTYQEALDSGLVGRLRTELMRNFKMGVKLETWLNSYTPPLASGGNAGVSGEV